MKGSALELDGNDYINLGATDDLESLSSVTLTAWIKPATTAPSYQTIFDKGLSNQLLLRLDSGGKIRAGVAGNIAGTALGIISANTWTHVAMTWDGINASIYVNGILEGSQNFGGSIGDGDSFIGQDITNSDRYSGLIDDLQIFNSYLAPVNISAFYTSLSRPDMPGSLVASTRTDQISLSWMVPNDGGTVIIYYRVYRSTQENGVMTVIGSTTTNNFVDSDVTIGTKYYYAVTATNAIGESEKSTIVDSIPQTTTSDITSSTSSSTSGPSTSSSTLNDINGFAFMLSLGSLIAIFITYKPKQTS
ncbi:MAG: LamG-like jellyroll fold domain-containing protein [Candidatus Kariarchaeaceae archaeon]|jgi:hypothetical protein